MKKYYTEEEIKKNEDLLLQLQTSISLEILIKNNIDTGNYSNPIDAVDIIINSHKEGSLMQYLIISENYEMCNWIQKEYDNLIKNN